MLETKVKYDAEKLLDKFLKAEIPEIGVWVKDDTPIYNSIQPAWCSNENNAYMRELVKEGDKVLAVTGSIDQSLNFILHGAKEVYGVDINPLQMPIAWLKYYSILILPKFRNYMDFIINSQSSKVLGEYYMEQILNSSETQGEVLREFWSKLTFRANPIAIRKKYLMGEKNYIINKTQRVTKFEYLSEGNFKRLKEKMQETTLVLSEGDIFKTDIPEDTDIVYLSNLHNFCRAETYLKKIDIIMSKLKTGAKVVIYCIGMKAEWFEQIRSGRNFVAISDTDLDLTYIISNQMYMAAIKQQITETMILYAGLIARYDVKIISVSTGKGYKMYNTSEDCAVIVTK